MVQKDGSIMTKKCCALRQGTHPQVSKDHLLSIKCLLWY